MVVCWIDGQSIESTRVHVTICWGDREWPSSASSQSTVKASILKLNQEPGKKSKFSLDTASASSSSTNSSFQIIDKPARLVIQLQPDNGTPSAIPLTDVDVSKTPPFFLGGFQIVGNFRHSEVYITDSDGKETYLMTSKGIPFQKPSTSDSAPPTTGADTPLFKAVCVVPGGPRQVHRLTIKLLSVKPPSQTQVSLAMLQLTGRIPPSSSSGPSAPSASPVTPEPGSGASSIPTQKTTMPSSQPSPPPAAMTTTGVLSQTDLGAAMASMSILARATEENISKTVTQQFQSLSTNIQTSLMQQVHLQQQQHLQLKLSNDAAQKSMQEFQQNSMQQNQLLMQSMSEQMAIMLEQQQALTQTVAQLQTEVHTLRQALMKQQKLPNNVSQGTLGEVCDHSDTTKDSNSGGLANAGNNGSKNDRSKPANSSTSTSTDEEDILERGIEQTLSNLELVAENDDSDDDEGETPSGVQAPTTTTTSLESPSKDDPPMTKQQVDGDTGEQDNDDDAFLAETIEVTLLHDQDAEKPLQEQVHQTLPTINPPTTTTTTTARETENPSSIAADTTSSDTPATTTATTRSVVVPPPNDPSIPQITRSFEDRNDKSHTNDSDDDALDTIDIELLQGDMNETVELIGEPSTEHERNPPEVQEGNLLDL
eukprot:Nitzschia sp. Nitz4//scaffold75_size92586//7177//9366//NITZ4_004838-RA/size92586-snap-gene-0.55-mRNA-1//-1//CDS//3329557654//3566//frame0